MRVGFVYAPGRKRCIVYSIACVLDVTRDHGQISLHGVIKSILLTIGLTACSRRATAGLQAMRLDDVSPIVGGVSKTFSVPTCLAPNWDLVLLGTFCVSGFCSC